MGNLGVIMNKHLRCILSLSLIVASIATCAVLQPQGPLAYENYINENVRIFEQQQHSHLMFSKEQKEERKRLELERIAKERKRKRARKFLLALFLPIAFKFGFLLPLPKLLGFSSSIGWSKAAATIPLSMGRKSIKMSMRNKRKKDKNAPKNKSFGSKILNFGMSVV